MTQSRTPDPKSFIKGATGDWEVVVGMEVHAQVNSEAKLFSGASTAFGGAPNTHVSLVDAAMPGMLPVINARMRARRRCAPGWGSTPRSTSAACSTARTISTRTCRRATRSASTSSPIVGEGEVVVDLDGGQQITVGIERLHLEQDAGQVAARPAPHHEPTSTSTAPASR